MAQERGKFITLEGGEGAGKSTQIKRLSEALRDTGLSVLETREPGGAPGAEDLRKLLVDGDVSRWDGETETLLHFAARRDHVVHTVWPALERGDWVISDRFADSTYAYQGYAHGVDLSFIDALYELTLKSFRPDLTFILDLPAAEGLQRAGKRIGEGGGEDRYERMGTAFHEKLREGFLKIAEKEPERCVVIDAKPNEAQVFRNILAVVTERFKISA